MSSLDMAEQFDCTTLIGWKCSWSCPSVRKQRHFDREALTCRHSKGKSQPLMPEYSGKWNRKLSRSVWELLCCVLELLWTHRTVWRPRREIQLLGKLNQGRIDPQQIRHLELECIFHLSRGKLRPKEGSGSSHWVQGWHDKIPNDLYFHSIRRLAPLSEFGTV